jgi:hypothetical protein
MAPVTGLTLKVCGTFGQMLFRPVIALGVPGALPGSIALVRAIDGAPQPLATTEMVPLLAPGITLMELVVELPLQPLGSVQV